MTRCSCGTPARQILAFQHLPGRGTQCLLGGLADPLPIKGNANFLAGAVTSHNERITPPAWPGNGYRFQPVRSTAGGLQAEPSAAGENKTDRHARETFGHDGGSRKGFHRHFYQ